jgi:opacity protein-like surface antigen
VGAGVKYDISESMAIDLGYRFKSLGKLNFKDGDGSADFPGATLNSHNVQLGLTFKF